MRWLVGPVPRLQINCESAGTLLSINGTNFDRWSLWAFVTGVSFPAPANGTVGRVTRVPRNPIAKVRSFTGRGSRGPLSHWPVLGRKRLSQMPKDSIYRNLYHLSKAGYPPIRN